MLHGLRYKVQTYTCNGLFWSHRTGGECLYRTHAAYVTKKNNEAKQHKKRYKSNRLQNLVRSLMLCAPQYSLLLGLTRSILGVW